MTEGDKKANDKKKIMRRVFNCAKWAQRDNEATKHKGGEQWEGVKERQGFTW